MGGVTAQPVDRLFFGGSRPVDVGVAVPADHGVDLGA